MKRLIKAYRGFTWIELVVTLSVLVILGFVATPAYINYSRRLHFTEITTALAPYQAAITECFQNLKTLKGCSGGANHIPANITAKKGPVNSVIVTNGVITVVPVSAKGIAESDTYILTPTPKDKKLTWVASGGAVSKGYVDEVKIAHDGE